MAIKSKCSTKRVSKEAFFFEIWTGQTETILKLEYQRKFGSFKKKNTFWKWVRYLPVFGPFLVVFMSSSSFERSKEKLLPRKLRPRKSANFALRRRKSICEIKLKKNLFKKNHPSAMRCVLVERFLYKLSFGFKKISKKSDRFFGDAKHWVPKKTWFVIKVWNSRLFRQELRIDEIREL